MSSVSRTLFMGGRRALSARSFHSSARRMADATPLPSKKPMGAFRGGLFGFLFGCVMSGGGVYSYLLQEYKASNDLLTEDIYVRALFPGDRVPLQQFFTTLQASVTRLSNYVKNIEEKTKK